MQTYVIVSPYFPTPESWRGAYVYDFAVALRRTGRYDVRVFVPGRGPDYTYQGIHVTRFRHRMLPSASLPFLFDRANRRGFLNRLRSAGIDPQDIAVCHAHTAFFATYALAVKTVNPRCQALLHHHSPDSFGLYIGRLNRFLWHRRLCWPTLVRLHEGIDLHVCISEAVRQSLLGLPDVTWPYPGYAAQLRGLEGRPKPRLKATAVLHNGVDLHRFTAEGHKAPGTEPFTVGCVANFIGGKDQLTLLRAMALLRDRLGDWRLRLIGSGPTRAACEAFVTGNGLQDRITFEPETDHTELPAFYRSLDLFVLPSYFEGFGCVFTEAWACGTPFIACEGQGISELIPPEEAPLWLCRPRQPEQLARMILRFAETRPRQHLTETVDIDTLVGRFAARLKRRTAPTPAPVAAKPAPTAPATSSGACLRSASGAAASRRRTGGP